MFSRWRNLAAAAGALCFPFSLVRASLPGDDPSYLPTAPCIRFQETNDESSWFRTERDSWYQQYYGNALDDGTITNDPLVTPPTYNAHTKPTVIISDIESIDECNDDLTSDENSDECDYIHCPCHDILNSDDDEADEDPGLETTTPSIDLESEFFDVYAPYAYPNVTSGESSKSEPTAELTGSIETISDDSESAWFDESFCGDAQSHQDSAVLVNEIDPMDDCDADEADETGPTIDSNNSNNDGSKYHMFYPGCDWSPYYPASKSTEPSGPQLPEDVHSA